MAGEISLEGQSGILAGVARSCCALLPGVCGFPGTIPDVALPWMPWQWRHAWSFLLPAFPSAHDASSACSWLHLRRQGRRAAASAERACVGLRCSARRALGPYTLACSFLCLCKILATLLAWRSNQIEEALKFDFLGSLAKEKHG